MFGWSCAARKCDDRKCASRRRLPVLMLSALKVAVTDERSISVSSSTIVPSRGVKRPMTVKKRQFLILNSATLCEGSNRHTVGPTRAFFSVRTCMYQLIIFGISLRLLCLASSCDARGRSFIDEITNPRNQRKAIGNCQSAIFNVFTRNELLPGDPFSPPGAPESSTPNPTHLAVIPAPQKR